MYSVGNDQDDGGRVPLRADGKPAAWMASYWFRGREKPPDGDWVVYPEPSDPAD